MALMKCHFKIELCFKSFLDFSMIVQKCTFACLAQIGFHVKVKNETLTAMGWCCRQTSNVKTSYRCLALKNLHHKTTHVKYNLFSSFNQSHH